MLKKEVLRGKDAFSKVYNRGKSVGGRFTVLFYRPNDLGYNRLAFLASKKVGNSVIRNRASRLMKQSYREIIDSHNLEEGYDIIFIARKGIINKKCKDVKNSMEFTLRKAKLTTKKKVSR